MKRKEHSLFLTPEIPQSLALSRPQLACFSPLALVIPQLQETELLVNLNQSKPTKKCLRQNLTPKKSLC